MSDPRTHSATTSDGVTLVGTVRGEGPPVVFWHGAYGDGDLDWQSLTAHLADRFTCYLPSWRGRGRSGDHRDVGYGRRVGDIVEFVESVDGRTGLVSWSGGANPALAAAARTDRLNALAVIEPTMGRMMDEEDRAGFGGAVVRMGQVADEGRMADALRAAARFPMNDEEMAVVEDAAYFDAAARYVPNLLEVFRQLGDYKGSTADDPAVLSAISVPVLVLHGERTKPFWTRSARYVSDHVPYATIQELPGAGHFAPLTHPEAVAEALAAFFTTAEQQAH